MSTPVRRRPPSRAPRRVPAVVLGLLVGLLLAGCSDHGPAPPAAAPTTAAPVPTYDASLAPSAAVLALVPESATTLTLTDLDDVRDDLGVTDLTTASPVAEQDAFWARATAGAPLLAPGLLREPAERLRTGYGLSQLDVAWEAHFFTADGAEIGWVLSMRPGTDLAAVARAVDDGVGALAGSTVRAELGLVTSGTTDDGAASWAADPDLTDLVGLRGAAWWVDRSCVAGEPDGAAVPSALDELGPWSVQLESALATARLGPDRLDLFERMRISTAFAPFAAVFEGGVSDPLTGRIGFRMTDPVAAADLVQRRRLPFAACAPS